MFYIFSKLFGIVITSPVCYCFLFLIVAIWVKKRKTKIICVITSCTILLFCSNKIIYDNVLKSWSTRSSQTWNPAKEYSYGIILGGFSTYNKDAKRIEFNQTADRWIDGVLLYKKGHIKKIVIASDGSVTSNDNIGNPAVMIDYLTTFGVRPDDIILELKARNTRENATYTLPLLGKDVLQENCLLITSAAHMKRSVSCFKQVGFTPDTYVTDFNSGQIRTWKDWIPDFRTFSDWQDLIHEWIGSVAYRIMGY